jgi:hypothetical protein
VSIHIRLCIPEDAVLKEVSDSPELSTLKRALQLFVKVLARNFKVSVPKVELYEVIEKDENLIPLPQYDDKSETIFIPVREFTESLKEGWSMNFLLEDWLEMMLHEFWHHYQYVRSGRDRLKAFGPENDGKVWIERSYEKEAEAFSQIYAEQYRSIWKQLMKRPLSELRKIVIEGSRNNHVER